MTTTYDVVIVGAGVFGLVAALALQERGYQVALLDQGPVPHPLASSTDISKVVRLEYGPDEAYMVLAERARDGWLRWNETFGETLYHEDGLTMLTRGPMTSDAFTYNSYQLLQKRGHEVERLDQQQIAQRFPAWNAARYIDGYYNPLGGYAESGRVTAALADLARDAGVALHLGQPVQALVEERERVVGVELRDRSRVSAAEIIVAAGAWTPSLLPELANVMRIVGQPIFHVKPQDADLFRPPHFYTFSADVSHSGWYGFALHPQEQVIKLAHHGAGRAIDPVHGERRVSDSGVQALRAFLAETFPPLKDAPLVYTRLCLYCDVRDGHFWIDRHPQKQGLTIASGGSGHGFKFAPVLGNLIADAMEGKSNADLHRFRWRTLADDTVNQEATRYQEVSSA